MLSTYLRQGYSIGAILLLTLLCACGAATRDQPAPYVPYVAPASSAPLQQPLPTLDSGQREAFARGLMEFNRRWVPFPGVGGQWGRGPLASGDSCDACHPANGRGRLPAADVDDVSGAVLRLGQFKSGLPDPVYGRQLDPIGVLGKVPAEGRVQIEWREHRLSLDDGEVITLRAPRVRPEALAYGALHADTRMSLRVAPALVGIGLLAAVAESEFARLQRQQTRLGVVGTPNLVLDAAHRTMIAGRFGWKASQPTLRQQSALAFSEDIGITSHLFATQTCTLTQRECNAAETVPHPELKPAQLDDLLAYLEHLAVPAPRPAPPRGAALFEQLGCGACHAGALRTRTGQRIAPYTDLMLHDMGAGLADEVGEFEALGSLWRTPPLWGLGVTANGFLLHDGRAARIEEAILWHGGQAESARRGYARLSRADRAILLAYLHTL